VSPKKPNQVRLYLNEEAADLVKSAASAIGEIPESQIVSILVLAGLRALKEEGFNLTLPLKLSVVPNEENAVPSALRI
jgi:hypothetical protein